MIAVEGKGWRSRAIARGGVAGCFHGTARRLENVAWRWLSLGLVDTQIIEAIRR